MKTYIITIILLALASSCYAQSPDFIFKENKRQIIDSNITLENSAIDIVDIGPSTYSGRETFFFENTTWITKMDIQKFNTNHVFYKNLNIQQSEFQNQAIFDTVTAGHIQINNNIFNNGIYMTSNNMSIRVLSFIENKFNGNSTQLKYSSELSEINVTQELSFINCLFLDALSIRQSYSKRINIYDCKFNSFFLKNCTSNDINIINSNFEYAFLSFMNIDDSLLFEKCLFDKNLIIAGINKQSQHIVGDNTTYISFKNSVLPDTIELSNNDVHNVIFDFTNADYTNKKKKIVLLLIDTDPSKIKLDYRYFKLAFKRGDDKSNLVSNSDIINIYRTLLNNFKKVNDKVSYQLLDIEFKDYKNTQKTLFSKYSGLLHKYWNNYGYDYNRLQYWGIGFLILFTVINIFLLNSLNTNVYNYDNIPFISNYYKGAWLKRIWYSLAYTSFVFFSITIKFEKLKLKKPVLALYYIIIYLFGLFTIYLYIKKVVEAI